MGTIADRLHASDSTRPGGRGLANAAFDGFTWASTTATARYRSPPVIGRL
ncbi:hypothetical protein [Streptomyces peucetius]